MDIILEKLNEVYFRVHADFHILQELRDFLTFKVPGYKFMPQFRNKLWDGNKCLLNRGNTVYIGLYSLVKNFAEKSNYSIEIDPELSKKSPFSREKIEEFVKLVTPEGTNLEVRDYQMDAIVTSIQDQRQINLSCTGSGKSAIIYYIVRWYAAMKKKVLIIVPTVNLVEQLHSDFKDYAKGTWDVDNKVQKIYSGFSKDIQCPVVISTWQSVFKLPKQWFNQFYTFIGDEAHLHKAAAVSGMIEKMTEVPVKLGTTGTLDEKNQKVHILVLIGLFGPTRDIARSKDLMDRGYLSPLEIQMVICKYPDEERELVKKLKFQDEMKYIVTHKKRNKLIANITSSFKGVTLLLIQNVDHGEELFTMIRKIVSDTRKVFYIHGGVEGEVREAIRKIVSDDDSAIIVATFGTMSTGTNIPGIEYLVLGTSSKSKYRTLQSIGRGLRNKKGKEKCILVDIADDFTWKSKKNTTLLHAAERLKMYSAEGFEYKIFEVKL